MARSKGLYVTKGRALELERQIEDARRELGERVAAAEARAQTAEARVEALYELLLKTRGRGTADTKKGQAA